MNRRAFLSTGVKAGVLVGAPLVVPSSALGKSGTVPPSERIILGGIVVGNRGRGVLAWMMREKDVQFVANCDLNKARGEMVTKMVNQKYGNNDCKLYNNMHEFLAERPDIDAILTATGDRWHALSAITIMRAGKDVYCEKPSCMTIAEGQAVVETARKYGRVYQTGTQRVSDGKFVIAMELARMGRLGKVHTARAHIAPWHSAIMSHDWLPAEPEPPKEEVDWDMWLGPCPWRPYNKKYVWGGWRGYYDFHTSSIGEWGAHTFAQAQAGLGLLNTSPVHYGYVKDPTAHGMVTTFANGIKMTLSRGNEYWRGPCGMRFEGDEGWVAVADGYRQPDVSNPKLLEGSDKILRDYVARTGRALSHVRNLFDCIKSRRQTMANPEAMYRSMTTVHAANICMWLKRDMRYDPEKAEFIGDEEANRMRSRAMRAPYIIYDEEDDHAENDAEARPGRRAAAGGGRRLGGEARDPSHSRG
jgi:predicted dehydrogenase